MLGSVPRQPYAVILAFSEDGNELEECDCDCPAFAQYEGICKHIIAAVLKFQSLSTVKTVPVRSKRSDNTAISMLNRYAQSIADKAGETHEGRAKLEPVLEHDGVSEVSVFFRVGEKRMYIVPDLIAFKMLFQGHHTADYGKNFTLWHVNASFDAGSRLLLEFIQKRYDGYNHIYSTNKHYGYYSSGVNKRNMYLSSVMTDELFAMLEGKSVAVRDDKKRETTVLVKREDYRPRLRLEPVEGGATLEIIDWYIPFHGDRRVYILTRDRATAFTFFE